MHQIMMSFFACQDTNTLSRLFEWIELNLSKSVKKMFVKTGQQGIEGTTFKRGVLQTFKVGMI